MRKIILFSILLSISIFTKAQTPDITDITTWICSLTPFDVSPLNGNNGTVPTGTTYSWGAPELHGNLYVSIGSSGSNQTSINGMISNPSGFEGNVVYTVTPTANGNLGHTFKITIIVNPTPFITNVSSASVCSGSAFTVSPTTGVNGNVPQGTKYSWVSPSISGGVTGASSAYNQPAVSATLSNQTASAQTVTYTITPSHNFCNGNPFTLIVTVNPTPVANAGSNATINCIQNSNSAQLGTSSVAGNTYSWSPTTGLSNATSNNPIATPQNTTTYTLTTTNTTGGCTATNSVVVSVVNTPPIANAGANALISCKQNTNGVQLGASAISGNTYSWLPTTGISNATISNPMATPTITTTYTLTAANSTSGCTASNFVVVTVDKTLPTADAGSNDTVSCTKNPNGAQVGTTSVLGCTYSWSASPGYDNVAAVSNPIVYPSPTIDKYTNVYTLTVTKTSNGCTATDSVYITSYPYKNNLSANTGNQSVIGCTNNTGSIQLGGAAEKGITYLWAPSEGLSSSTISNPIASPTVTTKYRLTITDTTGCSAAGDILVEINKEKPIADAGSDVVLGCKLFNSEIGSEPISYYSYAWSPSTGLNKTDIGNPTSMVLTNTTYTLSVTDMNNGCTATDDVIVFYYSPCDSLGSKDTVAQDTTGYSHSNQIFVQMDTCIFDYSVPLDSFAIVNYVINQSNLILHMEFYQNKNVIKLNVPVPLSAIKQENNLLELTINCSHDKSLNSGHKTTFKTGLKYITTSIGSIANSVKCYPNPANDRLYIELPLVQNEQYIVNITTANGVLIYSEKFSTSHLTVNISDYPSGIYILKINSNNDSYVKRIIKM